MKVLVTGVSGQLGDDVIKELRKRDFECYGSSSTDFDLVNLDSTVKFIKAYHPDGVIHCAAYTAVDKAEYDIDFCRAINVQGTRNIASVCKKIDAKMIYVSTDYVFQGLGNQAYEVDDPTGPLGTYGLTKLDGEVSVKELMTKYFIVRTSWLFGRNGNNFVKTMLKLGRGHDEIAVVDDQIGSPTYTVDLASLLCDMIETEKYGIFHATNEGFCSWAEFATEIFKQSKFKTRVKFIPTPEDPARANRPLNSKLSKKSLYENGFKLLPIWQDGLRRFLNEI